MRRRIYLMRHADVAYFDNQGRPFSPEAVALTARGEAQARAAGEALAAVRFDQVITSGLPRTVKTAQLVLSEARASPLIEEWPELAEIRGGRLRDIPDNELKNAFLGAFQGVVHETAIFLGGESIASLLDRVHSGIDRLLSDASWDTVLMVLHGGVNRAILSLGLTGGRSFLGNLAQSPGCINVLDVSEDRADWVVRAVNITPMDGMHLEGERSTTMEELLRQYLVHRKL
jgi:broad specificity phosphatase PhoE